MYFHFVTILVAVSALLSVSISAATMLPNHTATFMDTARCFSCMSRLYEAVWPALSSIYKKPKNFTDLCNENNLDPQAVPFTYCPTICIRMWEEPAVADEQLVGVRIRGHIRGCLDELLYNGFNQTIVTWYRWMHRDSCRQYRKRELFKLPTELSDDSYISISTSREVEQNQLQSTAVKTLREFQQCEFY
uniref:Saposin B-type domain-containing protein n=1 Tax=Wuchereria bancrofti TaxID=6293 RepID=A0AAF5PU91_WUCBA